MPRLEVDAVFRLDVIQNLQNVLGVVNPLRDLAELLPDPVHIPVKLDEGEDHTVLFLPGELCELHRIQLQGRENLREELGRPCLKEGTVTHFDCAGRLGGQGLAVDGEAGGGLDDDLTLIGALVDDTVPLRTVCEGETDGIQHGGLAGSFGAGDLHGLPV